MSSSQQGGGVMNSGHVARFASKWAGMGIGFVALSYAGYAATTFLRYGKRARTKVANADPLLDMFMPNYDVVDCRHVRIAAPAALVLTAATEMHMENNPVIR